MTTYRIASVVTILGTALLSTGCVSFSGPNDVRRAILAAEPEVALETEEAISVGPLGIMLAKLFVGRHIPPELGHVSAISYGQYRIRSVSSSGDVSFSLPRLELSGWERIVRVREGGSETAVMIGGTDRSPRRLLFLHREGDELQIIKVHGDFARMIDAILESDWLFDDLDDVDGAMCRGAATRDGPDVTRVPCLTAAP